MKKFTIEVVASSVLSCINAEKGGANRIELCSALATAGVTPSNGMLIAVKENISIPVFVMIRPREGDFCYDKREIETFKREIDSLQKAGADGFVFGLLLPNGHVDVKSTRELVDFCKPYPVTFHRAVDCTPNPVNAIEDIVLTGCERVLTSGGAATGPEGRDNIMAMNEKANGRISVMPGGGIRPDTFPIMLHDTIHEYHLSGRKPVISESSVRLFDMDWAETDELSISEVVAKAEMFFS